MTETTAITDAPEHERIDWFAFVFALILAPFLVAILGFWALGIPVFALVFGPPTYLLFGAPTFALAISLFRANGPGLAVAGFLANILSIPAVYFYFQSQGNGMEMVNFINGIGCAMAPLWGAAFGLLYRQFQIEA